jgi:Family of unknown function (DUF6510)
MDATDLRLDGNAVAGLLGEVFAAEMTSALETCDGCGATHALGAVHVYAQAPGVVMRCPDCEAILICITRIRGRLLVDASGVRVIELEAPGS